METSRFDREIELKRKRIVLLENKSYNAEYEKMYSKEELEVTKEVIKEIPFSFNIFITLIAIVLTCNFTHFNLLYMLLSGFFTSKSIGLIKKYVPDIIDKKIKKIDFNTNEVLKELDIEINEIKKEIKELEDNKSKSISNKTIDRISELKELKESFMNEEVIGKDKVKLK